MSDYVIQAAPTTDDNADRPAFLSRLREGYFTSPNGIVSHFMFDILKRGGSKKAAVHEIADSDDAVIQDLGDAVRIYPMEIYFIGPDYDQNSDAFFESLHERYTPDNPGLLAHPRWGDIPVIPFSVAQEERFIDGAGVGYFTVEFRETKSVNFASSAAQAEAKAAARMDDLEAAAGSVADGIDVGSASAYAQAKASFKGAVKKLNDAVDGISDDIADIQDEVTDIKNTINEAVDALSSPAVIIAQIGSLVRTVANVFTDTPKKVATIADVTLDLINSYTAEIASLVKTDEKSNAAAMLETVGGVCAGALVEAAYNTDFDTRDAVGSAIDQIVETYAAYLAAIDAARATFTGNINTTYIPSHDLGSILQNIVKEAAQVLIDRAFSLKTKRTFHLKAPSDPLTLCWKYYQDVSNATIEYFCRTNRIAWNEFIEIPTGREIVIYA